MLHSTSGRAGEWGMVCTCTADRAASAVNLIQSNSTRSNPRRPQPKPPPSCALLCSASGSRFSLLGSLLPIACCRPGPQGRSPYTALWLRAACRHMWPAISCPSSSFPPPSRVTFVASTPKCATSSGASSPALTSQTLTYSMLTFLSKHLYLPCLSLLPSHIGTLWSGPHLPGLVGTLQ